MFLRAHFIDGACAGGQGTRQGSQDDERTPDQHASPHFQAMAELDNIISAVPGKCAQLSNFRRPVGYNRSRREAENTMAFDAGGAPGLTPIDPATLPSLAPP